MTYKVHTRYEAMSDSTEIVVVRRDSLDKRSVMLPPRFDVLPATAAINESQRWALEDSDARDFMQAMLGAAWEMGLRPAGFEDHTNELTAVRYHLEDMRTLAKVNK